MTLKEARTFVLQHSHDAGRVLGRWSWEKRRTWNMAWDEIGIAKTLQLTIATREARERRRLREEARRIQSLLAA